RVRVTANGKAVPLAGVFADHEQPDYPASGLIDDDPNTGWAINVGKGQKATMNTPHEAVILFENPVETNS
ncbi:MAG: hypothetical protein GWO24_24525, partial [Akkermansiaceae bacterium]|nr:hypothetical protein [Akkermansiaceae bacterium]